MKLTVPRFGKLLMILGMLTALLPLALVMSGEWMMRHGIGGAVVALMVFAYLVPLGALIFAAGFLVWLIHRLRNRSK